jgi:hypothetical protein
MLPPWIEPESVLASTIDVASLFPFQRITGFALKFVPTTLMVAVVDPAAMVRGRTVLMLGAASACTSVTPQPNVQKQAARPKVTLIAFSIFKTHLELAGVWHSQHFRVIITQARGYELHFGNQLTGYS